MFFSNISSHFLIYLPHSSGELSHHSSGDYEYGPLEGETLLERALSHFHHLIENSCKDKLSPEYVVGFQNEIRTQVGFLTAFLWQSITSPNEV